MPTNETDDGQGVAIIGMSGRFPGAANVEELWRVLANRVDAISRFPEEDVEYSVATLRDRADGSRFVRARGVLADVDKFDAGFFGVHPREAEVMDPQHRLFLECAWEAIEAAGYNLSACSGSIGVYAGCSFNTYLLYNLCRNRSFAANLAAQFQVGEYPTMLGNNTDFLATRISYKLDLKGPSMSVQCACSTSLVAVCQACTSLLTYQCDMALAGGASITFPQRRDYLYQEGSLVSGDGTCRAFDAAADGTVFGHGVAVVLLKRLADAMRDGDHVLAVIKGTAVNNDGAAKVSFAAPSIQAQANVIALAQAAAGVDPESISYVEAHGTGTPLGDPIEVAALTQAFRSGGATRKGYCALGTAKTNISHLDVAAGATGLIKTVLQLKHEQIPPLLHFTSPNPKIDFAASPFFPVERALEWKQGAVPRRAGVSSFGVGGTNAHVVVEEAPAPRASGPSRPQQLLLLSARTETALERMTENLANHLRLCPETPLADVAFTLQTGRKYFAHRKAIVAADHAEAVSKLAAGDRRSVPTGLAAESEPAIVFLFPGQGAQYVDMGRDLYEGEPVFRTEVDRCAEILQVHLGIDIREAIYPEPANRAEAENSINQTTVTQPAIFVIEYALARLWMSWGVRPSIVIGHSVGEYVAAVLAETFTLGDALALLAARARLINALPAGSMLAVRMDGKEVQRLLPAGISVAAMNSPKLCTISGQTALLEAFQNELERRQVASRFLTASHAFHSAMMDPMIQEFTEITRNTPRQQPRLPWISTCTGDWVTAADVADPAYWARQLRQTVHFGDAVAKACETPNVVFLEVGPGQALAQIVCQQPFKPPRLLTLSTLDATSPRGSDLSSMLASLGRLWIAGVNPNVAGFYAEERRRRVPLPTYPFERQRYWIEPARAETAAEAGLTAPGVAGGIHGVEKDSAMLGSGSPRSAPSDPDLAETIIQQQLRLMARQLDALQLAPGGTSGCAVAQSFAGQVPNGSHPAGGPSTDSNDATMGKQRL